MDIKIGNELIADFMGFTHNNHGWEDKHGNIFTDALDYDTDWNHLMNVVQSCFKTDASDEEWKEIEDALIANYNSDTERKHAVWIACLHLVQEVNKRK